MNTVQMSLHRVMAEIKSIEAALANIYSTQFVKVVQGEPRDDVAKVERNQFTTNAKSSLDKYESQIKNLSILKAARNKANSVITVTVNGKEMTIDEALAMKAVLAFKQTLVDTLFSQVAAAQGQTQRIQTEIEAKVSAQLASMFNNTRKANEDEINVIRGGFERSLKPITLAPEGIQTSLMKMKEEIVEFEKEIDFILSEANAVNKIEVSLI